MTATTMLMQAGLGYGVTFTPIRFRGLHGVNWAHAGDTHRATSYALVL